jgi:hypothetical protein
VGAPPQCGSRRRGAAHDPRVSVMTSVQPSLVSVLCVAYKHERFVGEAVRSVLAQTYAPLDIIILDDASPDATADVIAAELSKHSGRSDIRFIRNDRNLGIFGNIRNGLSLTNGDFIVIFCGDDVMLPTLVEKMVKVWQEADVSLVTANALYIDEDGNELNRFYTDPAGPCEDTFEALAKNGGNTITFGAAIGLERNLYREFGYPPEYLNTEDIMLAFYAYLAKGARFILEPLLKYRVHENNSSLSLKWERSTTPIDRLRLEGEMYLDRLVHSLEMAAELERRRKADPARLDKVARRIGPLLAKQTAEGASKLVEHPDIERARPHRIEPRQKLFPFRSDLCCGRRGDQASHSQRVELDAGLDEFPFPIVEDAPLCDGSRIARLQPLVEKTAEGCLVDPEIGQLRVRGARLDPRARDHRHLETRAPRTRR